MAVDREIAKIKQSKLVVKVNVQNEKLLKITFNDVTKLLVFLKIKLI